MRHAAERAKVTYANAGAISFYRSALEQIERAAKASRESHLDALIAICEQLGSILVLTGQRDEARLLFHRALDALGDGDPIRRARLSRSIRIRGA